MNTEVYTGLGESQWRRPREQYWSAYFECSLSHTHLRKPHIRTRVRRFMSVLLPIQFQHQNTTRYFKWYIYDKNPPDISWPKTDEYLWVNRISLHGSNLFSVYKYWSRKLCILRARDLRFLSRAWRITDAVKWRLMFINTDIKAEIFFFFISQLKFHTLVLTHKKRGGGNAWRTLMAFDTDVYMAKVTLLQTHTHRVQHGAMWLTDCVVHRLPTTELIRSVRRLNYTPRTLTGDENYSTVWIRGAVVKNSTENCRNALYVQDQFGSPTSINVNQSEVHHLSL